MMHYNTAMKKMKHILLVTVVLVFSLVSCKKEEVITITVDGASINFPKTGFDAVHVRDFLEFSSIFNLKKEVADIGFDVIMSGPIVDYDRTYTVTVIDSLTTLDAKYFSLEPKQVLPAGEFETEVRITINNKVLMNDAAIGSIVVGHVPDENFIKGLDGYDFMEVRVSGQGLLEKPIFWNNNKLDEYGGDYHRIKAEKFIELNDIDSPEWRSSGNMTIVYAYSKRTHDWFEANPTYDENGDRIYFKGTIEF